MIDILAEIDEDMEDACDNENLGRNRYASRRCWEHTTI